jgi:hypothetical protein
LWKDDLVEVLLIRVGDEDEDEGNDGDEGDAADSNELLLLLLRAGLNRNKALGFAGSVTMSAGITSGSATNDTRYLMELGVGDLDPATAEGCGDLPVEELRDPLSS